MSNRKPWEEAIHYSHDAETKDNPPYPEDNASGVVEHHDPNAEFDVGDGDEVDETEDYVPGAATKRIEETAEKKAKEEADEVAQIEAEFDEEEFS